MLFELISSNFGGILLGGLMQFDYCAPVNGIGNNKHMHLFKGSLIKGAGIFLQLEHVSHYSTFHS